ncbi:MAG TPA: helix-turn-helix transcriptional regulator, partial [Tepidisphaeraceae bacterium]|nr:helix-turn-helix transcriptional regulator [Tepidisphaeraceae bacterium]
MRRVNQQDLDFYDGVASRINRSLGDPACALTQSSLAGRIGWHRASLCNFLNRIDKTIAAHFIPRIAQTFRLSVEELMTGALTAAAEKTSWDPRSDDSEILVEKLHEWRQRNLPGIQLHGHLPPVVLPRRGMVANYVDSVFDGGFPQAAA